MSSCFRTYVPLVVPRIEGKLIRGFEGLDIGDRVRVELISTDVERGFIDFVRAAHPTDSALNPIIYS